MASNGSRGGSVLGCAVLLLALYAAGLSHGMAGAWTGMHDWNGAFFSQLARNCLRYPLSVHHGMPIVAVGEAVPAPEERSVYATHPPGLVWLVALAFGVLGESEWVARLVPVLFSLGTLALLIRLVARGWGCEAAIVAGLIYAVMPMAVYFGRMVNHEAVSLCLMLGAVAAWDVAVEPGARAARRRGAWGLFAFAMVGGAWVDWSGGLFAVLFAGYAGLASRWGGIARRQALFVWAVAGVGCAGMLAYLVYAGLEGRWGDLTAIFMSRATDAQGGALMRDLSARGGVWDYTVENLSWPVIVLSGIGAVLAVERRRRRPDSAGVPGEATASRASEGLCVVLATGVVWLLVFWRQYERHNYWLFYLGPAAAVYSALGLMAVRDVLRALDGRWARGVSVVVLAGVVAFCLRGTDQFFGRLSYPPAEVAAWRQIHAMTKQGDRLLVYRNPVRVERRGGYVFRNLVPPQQAYYLDRPFEVVRDIGTVAGHASWCAAFVLGVGDAAAHREEVDDLGRRFAVQEVFGRLVFDLRSAPKEGSSSLPGGDP